MKYRTDLIDSFYDEDMDLALTYWNARSKKKDT